MKERTRKNRKVSSWSDAEIRGMIDRFIQEEGRIPNTKDLKAPKLPPQRIFLPIYGVTAAVWLLANYGPSAPSYDERKVKYAEEFKAEYERLKPRTSDEYNTKKNPALPRWEALRKYYPDNFTCWTGMLEYFGLPRYIDREKEQPKTVFKVELVWH